MKISDQLIAAGGAAAEVGHQLQTRTAAKDVTVGIVAGKLRRSGPERLADFVTDNIHTPNKVTDLAAHVVTALAETDGPTG